MEKIKLVEMGGIYEDGVWKKYGNSKVFQMYNTVEACSNDINLCGDNQSGILIEESLEVALKHSDIDLICSNEKICIMSQHNKFFKAKILWNNAGSTEADYHLDFNSVREIS